jgi:hypothetical protein
LTALERAHTGPHLAKIGRAADDKRWRCDNGASQTPEHLFKHHSQGKKEKLAISWREMRKATGGKRSARTSTVQLFGGPEMYSGSSGVFGDDGGRAERPESAAGGGAGG